VLELVAFVKTTHAEFLDLAYQAESYFADFLSLDRVSHGRSGFRSLDGDILGLIAGLWNVML
jgi:hypothetical protein